MSRFYITPESVKDDKIILKGDELHHVRDVMRLQPNEPVTAFDGTGKEYFGKIVQCSLKEAVIKIDKVVSKDNSRGLEITLACGLPKLDRMDYIIQKTTELGVNKIVPLSTRRTIVLLDNEKKSDSRLLRWQRIAIESSKQSGRSTLPQIETIKKFETYIKDLKDFDLAIIATLAEGTKYIKDVLSQSQAKKILVLIGPEGDFTKQEVDLALSNKCQPVSFGPLVLRCDTAAIYALSVLNYQMAKINK